MTFSEYRRYGFVSRLGEIVAKGPSQSTIDTQNRVTQSQLGLAQQQQGFSLEDRARALSLQQPLINQQTALASGDRNAAIAANMPVISQISAGYQGAHDSIFNNLRPGAGRDAALANLATQQYTAQGGAMAQSVQRAPEILANLGSGQGAFSLQELGASLSGYGGASTSNQASGMLQDKRQAAKWAPVMSLAGIAGAAAGGGIFGGGSKSGGGGLGPVGLPAGYDPATSGGGAVRGAIWGLG